MSKTNLHIIPWYTPAQWEKTKALCLDPDTMGASFDAWLQAAEKSAEFEQSRGANVNKVYLNADRFEAWAVAKGFQFVSKNRVAFAMDAYFGIA